MLAPSDSIIEFGTQFFVLPNTYDDFWRSGLEYTELFIIIIFLLCKTYSIRKNLKLYRQRVHEHHPNFFLFSAQDIAIPRICYWMDGHTNKRTYPNEKSCIFNSA